MAYDQDPSSFFRSGYSSNGSSVSFSCRDAHWYGAEAVDLNADGSPTTFSTLTANADFILALDNSNAGSRLLEGDKVFVSHTVAGFSTETLYWVRTVGHPLNTTIPNPSHFTLSTTSNGVEIAATASTSGVAHLRVVRHHLGGKAVDFDALGDEINYSTDVTKNTAHILTPTAVESKIKINDRVHVTTTLLNGGLVAGTTYWVVYSTFLGTTLGHELKLSLERGGLPVTITGVTNAVGGSPLLLVGPLNELSSADAHPATGDWRKIIAGTLEGVYQKWTNLATTDRPTRLNMTKAMGMSGNYATLTYTTRFTMRARGVEAIDHE